MSKLLSVFEGQAQSTWDVRLGSGDTLNVESIDSSTIGGGGVGATFVFSPGNPGPLAANVFNNWVLLQTAYTAVAGPKWIQFDPTFAAITIPAGAWSLEDATCVPSKAVTAGTVLVTFASGATFRSAHLTLENVIFQGSNTVWSLGPTDNSVLFLNHAQFAGSGGQIAPPILVAGGLFEVFANNFSPFGDGTNNVINLTGTATLAAGITGGAVWAGNALTGANTATATIQFDSSAGITRTSGGTIVPTYVLLCNDRLFQVVTTGTTAAQAHADVTLDTTGGAVTYTLEAAPTAGLYHRLVWKAGTIPPVINGNGNQVASWTNFNQSSAASQTISQVGGSGTLQFDGTQWWWTS